MLFSFLIQTLDRGKVVVGTTVSFNVHAHGFNHFELIAVAVNLKDLSLVFLEEPGDWEHELLSVWQTDIWIIVGNFEQTQIVGVMPLFKSANQVLWIPFSVSFLWQIFTEGLDVIVVTSHKDYAVGVDVLLELRLHHFSKCLFVDWVFFCWHLFALFIDGGRLFLWRLRNNEKYLLRSFV
jgi:hypothetical protein